MKASFITMVNSFNKTQAAIFPMQAMLSEKFLFSSFNILQLVFGACVVAVKCHPVIHVHALCSYILLVLWDQWIMDCMLFTFENRVPLMR